MRELFRRLIGRPEPMGRNGAMKELLRKANDATSLRQMRGDR